MENRPLWKHQEEAINKAFSPNTREIALFHEMGTGKTRTMIEILRRKYASEMRLMRTLVVCPLIVKRQWKAQILQYSKIKEYDILVLDGSEKRRCKQFADSVMVDGQLTRPRIVIVNPATMEMKDLMDMFRRWGPEIVVVDESHEFKAHNGVRAKALVPLADAAKYRIISTGSPITNTESDIFMQYRILDGGDTFGKNYFAFRKRYYVDENAAWAHRHNHFPKYVCPKAAQEEIRRLMYQKAVRALKKDCLDLPPFIQEDIDVELSAEQRKAYNEMKDDFITWIKGKHEEPRTVVAQLAITKAMKMQQIVSGFAFDENGVPVRFKKVPRLEVLKDLLTQLTPQHKVIVWANFIENYAMIAELCDQIGVKYAKIVGGMTEYDKNENKDAFNKDPEVRVLIGNQGAGGTGVELTAASYAIYYSKDSSLIKDEQSQARNYRGGSEIHEKVTRLDLVAVGTIDERVNDALAQKKDLAQFILDLEEV